MYSQKQINEIKDWLGSGSINIFGRPFSGKDSQGRQLANLLNGKLISGGEILRTSNISNNIQEHINSGRLIPKDDYINIVLPYLSQTNLEGRPLILSSVGRWFGEEEATVKALEVSKHPLKIVLYLNISDACSLLRWQARETNRDREGRHDDSKTVLITRFAEFEEKTLPVLDYYRRLGVLIEIDGNQILEDVTNDIIDKISEQIALGN